ncbi:MAG: aldehyde dehydrogenase [Xanthomonadaceae bacterium]|nr:aldehyde dehydrogenase [Xanthomonadaceae bacterium]
MNAAHAAVDDASPLLELAPTLARLRVAWSANPPTLAQRRDDLRRLRAGFLQQADAMHAAISADFGHRSRHENMVSETMIVVAEIDHALRHLRHWMKPRRVPVGWKFWPARAEIRSMPIGVVGIIAPWNYPVNLALVPLVSAIAAGNHVHLKPSELTPRTSAWLCSLLAGVFPADRVAVAIGGPDVGAAFAALPFDHLLFTGSAAVGRKVLAAAAPNLTPVTLELGGKSPAIVAPDFPVELAAARIASGKWFNAGQTCIGVDYVMIDAQRRDAFVAALCSQLRSRYGDLKDADDYTRIIDDRDYLRLLGMIDEARERGAGIVQPIAVDADRARRERLLPPTLVIGAPDDTALMRDEIFGPILPIRTYDTVDQAVAWISAHDRPLALYPFSHDRATIEIILQRTLSGGVSVNDTLLHFGVHALPFGGIGASGNGAIHGRAGFETFSKLLPVFRQARWAASDWIRPPYRGWVDRVIRMLAR